MMPNFRAGPSLQKPMSTGPFTALTPQNRPLDFQKTHNLVIDEDDVELTRATVKPQDTF
jgi:hypothetical protein